MKWFGRDKGGPVLSALLREYSAYKAPHVGNHLMLSDVQAQENLAYLQASKAMRLDTLQSLLTHYEIALLPAVTEGDHRPVIDATYRWAQREWAASVPAQIAHRSVWRTTHRHAEQIIYSLVMDCAIALGEIVIRHRPAFAWAVDLNPQNIKEQMPSANRVILQAPSVLHPGQQVIIDWEELVVSLLLKPQSAANQAINLWQRVCDEAISGATQGEGV